MTLKQKTTALEITDSLSGSNGRFEHYQFGNNVLANIPDYQKNLEFRSNGHSSNVLLRLFIRDRFCNIPVQNCDFTKCENCYAKTYNRGIEKYLCHDPIRCPAVNPAITDHKTFAPIGQRAHVYSKAKEAIDAGTNYA